MRVSEELVKLDGCPVCASQSAVPVGSVPDSLAAELNRNRPSKSDALIELENHVVRCRNCGLKYLNPRPSDALLEKLYDGWYRRGYSHNIASSDGDRIRETEFERHHLRFIERASPPGRTLLDVGTGTGIFPAVARRSGWKAQGIDFSSAAVSRAEAAGRPGVSRAKLSDIVERGEKFDVVTMFDYLEHTTTPMRDIADASLCLKPDGLLAVRVPNTAGLQSQIMGLGWVGVFSLHLSYFDEQSLRRAMASCGFEPVFRYRGNYQSLAKLLRDKYAWTKEKLRQRRLTAEMTNGSIAREEPHEPSPRVVAFAKGTLLEFVDHAGGWIGKGNQLYMIWRNRDVH